MLSEEIRLRIALLLWDRVLCVKCLVNVLRSPQPTVSRHLSILRNSGMVKTTRESTHTYYSLNFDGEFGVMKKKIITAFREGVLDQRPYNADDKRLMRVAKECDAECVTPA